MKAFWIVAAVLVGLLCAAPRSIATDERQETAAASEPILPPLQPWDGASRSLIAPADDPWITPAEKSGFRTTPSYEETTKWLRRLVAAAPDVLRMMSIGKSSDGRDIWMIAATTDRGSTPEQLRKNRRAIVLAQAGIHSGEIDGKDAGLMLLRDMTVRGTKRELLKRANFLFIPILNVDGHERSSRYSRVNQRGPEESGWRTTSRNLNLNRDYTKADAPEMRAVLRVLDRWAPDLYLDLHVTDGADYQYDITFGFNGIGGHSPSIARWLSGTFTPAVNAALSAGGHVPGPIDVPNWINPDDWTQGIKTWMADPRFSNGYGDVRHLPTVLVENHSLKPYEQRVLGTYLLLESALTICAETTSSLREAIQSDRARRAPVVPLAWEADPEAPAETVEYRGIEVRNVESEISGGRRVEFTGKPVTATIPFRRDNRVAKSVTRPKAYWVPVGWPEVIERLELHGIKFERLTEARELPVTIYRLDEPKFSPEPFEGRTMVEAHPAATQKRERFAAGSARVPTDQPLGDLAIVLLEPSSPDSFLRWGFFNTIFQQTEYIEPYVIEPMAERMLASDPQLAAAFKERLANDPAFRDSPQARLRWFYEKTPFVDSRWRLYPVGREESAE